MHYPVRRVKILSSRRNNTFGWVRKNGTKIHQGWDFEAPDGSELLAVASGKIVWIDSNDNTDYGCQIILRFTGSYGEDVYAHYAHTMPNFTVARNQNVMEGQVIGYQGSTGNARGSKGAAQHLHFEFRETMLGGKGLAGRIDPIAFFGDPPYQWIENPQLPIDVRGGWYETPAPEYYTAGY